MGSDESHFNVSVGSDGQSYKTMSTNHNLFDEKGEPKRCRTQVLPLTGPNALPLGQTGSLLLSLSLFFSPPERKKAEFSRGCNKNRKVPRCADGSVAQTSWPTYIINFFGFLSFRRLNAPSLGRPGQGSGLREGDGDGGVGWGWGAVADS